MTVSDHVVAEDQTMLVKAALQLLHENGINVHALVMDGSQPNQRTAKLLGAKLNIDDFEPSFPHPRDETPVHIVFDPSHMVKLMRNLLGDYGVLIDKDGDLIKWDYLIRLNEIQEKETLHLANPLRTSHIQFKNKKMNVRLATQAMSRSVATALDYLRIIGDDRFAGSQATSIFLRKVDQLFDRLNASCPRGLGLKAPLNINNLNETIQLMNDSVDYLMMLRTISGEMVVHSRRRMAIIGFRTAVEGITALARHFLTREEDPFMYFLPYKCSQDHLESFFSMIRRRGGWNNNPNVLQVSVLYICPQCLLFRSLMNFYERGVLTGFI